mmetsp:Transcript_27647/g.49920  ORF Transcript_27647/g.49920 Transcript_27647/m.49920 type:complete len:275 (+) Transcript_27647:261-1085(+)
MPLNSAPRTSLNWLTVFVSSANSVDCRMQFSLPSVSVRLLNFPLVSALLADSQTEPLSYLPLGVVAGDSNEILSFLTCSLAASSASPRLLTSSSSFSLLVKDFLSSSRECSSSVSRANTLFLTCISSSESSSSIRRELLRVLMFMSSCSLATNLFLMFTSSDSNMLVCLSLSSMSFFNSSCRNSAIIESLSSRHCAMLFLRVLLLLPDWSCRWRSDGEQMLMWMEWGVLFSLQQVLLENCLRSAEFSLLWNAETDLRTSTSCIRDLRSELTRSS